MTWNWDHRPLTEEQVERALTFIDETFERSWKERITAAHAEAKAQGCGIRVRNTFDLGFAGVKSVEVADDVPLGRAEVVTTGW